MASIMMWHQQQQPPLHLHLHRSISSSNSPSNSPTPSLCRFPIISCIHSLSLSPSPSPPPSPSPSPSPSASPSASPSPSPPQSRSRSRSPFPFLILMVMLMLMFLLGSFSFVSVSASASSSSSFSTAHSSPSPSPSPSPSIDKFVADPTFDILSPPELAAIAPNIQYHPAAFSSSFSRLITTAPLSLSWPDEYACNASRMTRNNRIAQENGQSYLETCIIVKKGECSPVEKLSFVTSLSVGSSRVVCVLLYDDECDVSSSLCGRELLLSGGERTIAGTLVQTASSTIPPFLSIATKHGRILTSYIKRAATNSNNTNNTTTITTTTTTTTPTTNPIPAPAPAPAPAPGPGPGPGPSIVRIRFPASGPCRRSDLSTLISVVNAYPLPLFDPMSLQFVGSTRSWSATASNAARMDIYDNNNLDPCIVRTRGIWCVNGSIILLDLIGTGINGPLHSAFGNFSHLRYINFERTPYINGTLPSSFRNLTSLQVITGAGNNNITNIDVLASIPSLRYVDFNGNQLTSIPSELWSLPNLTHVDFHNNNITHTLPTFINPQQYTYIGLSHNHINGIIPNFEGGVLQTFDIADNDFTGPLLPSSFSSLPYLRYLYLSFNTLSGPLPILNGSNDVVIIDMTNNSFSGPIPSTWLLPHLTTIRLSHNYITQFNFTSSHHLSYCDLSWNEIEISGQDGDDLTSVLVSSLSPSIMYLDLSHNHISGPWNWPDHPTSCLFSQLQWLSLSNNHITSIPKSVFHLGPAAVRSELIHVDLSNNNIIGSLSDTTPHDGLRVVRFHGNPKFIDEKQQLPTWSRISSTPIVSRDDVDTPYDCSPLIGWRGMRQRSFELTLDPHYYGYKGCYCVRGTYGTAPYCESLPTELIVGATPLTQRMAFSDGMLGDHRLSYGMDTVWSLGSYVSEYSYWNASYFANLTAVDETARLHAIADAQYLLYRLNHTYSNTPIGKLSEAHQQWIEAINTTIQPQYIEKTKDTTKIRQIHIHIHLTPQFQQFGDVIEIFSGAADLKGTRIMSIRGTDHTERNIHVMVMAEEASLNFRSRDPSGKHFTANYTVSYECPTSYHVDNITDSCVPDVILPTFTLSHPLQLSVYIISATSILIILIFTAFITYHHADDWVTSMSWWYAIMIQMGLICACVGSIFYAISPDQGLYVCIARPWLTALPLVIIISAMLAKAIRCRDPPDPPFHLWDLIFVSFPLCTAEIVLLALFTFSNLTTPHIFLDQHTYVHECHSKPAYNTWIIVQCAYVAILMLVTVGVAFRYRARCYFSELSHLLHACLLLISCSTVLVLSNYYLSSYPNALLLVRGVIQSLGSCLVCILVFTPLLIHVYEKNRRSHVHWNPTTSVEIGMKSHAQQYSCEEEDENENENDELEQYEKENEKDDEIVSSLQIHSPDGTKHVWRVTPTATVEMIHDEISSTSSLSRSFTSSSSMDNISSPPLSTSGSGSGNGSGSEGHVDDKIPSPEGEGEGIPHSQMTVTHTDVDIHLIDVQHLCEYRQQQFQALAICVNELAQVNDVQQSRVILARMLQIVSGEMDYVHPQPSLPPMQSSLQTQSPTPTPTPTPQTQTQTQSHDSVIQDDDGLLISYTYSLIQNHDRVE